MSDARTDDEADVDVFERPAGQETPDIGDRWVTLPSAGMLSIEDADALLRWRDASLVAVVGERKGGKTTLITEMYEQFVRGPFANCLFSHSLSLLGFERKSFQSRAESGASVPDTPRTSKQDGLSFFHLAVCGEDDLRRTDLLLSERAGEVYREVRDLPAGAAALTEVSKARTIVFIVDGERLADGKRRAEAISSVRNIARAIVESGAAVNAAEVQLVTTKSDLLQGSTADPAIEALALLEERFLTNYESRFASVTTHRTAARDPKGEMEAAYGLASLLRSWLAAPDPAVVGPAVVPNLVDEFDRLLKRKAA